MGRWEDSAYSGGQKLEQEEEGAVVIAHVRKSIDATHARLVPPDISYGLYGHGSRGQDVSNLPNTVTFLCCPRQNPFNPPTPWARTGILPRKARSAISQTPTSSTLHNFPFAMRTMQGLALDPFLPTLVDEELIYSRPGLDR